MQSNRGFSARVCIHTANGLYRAGLDLCHSLLCGHVEPSEALWQADSHSMGQPSADRKRPLQGHTAASLRRTREGHGGIGGRVYT